MKAADYRLALPALEIWIVTSLCQRYALGLELIHIVLLVCIFLTTILLCWKKVEESCVCLSAGSANALAILSALISHGIHKRWAGASEAMYRICTREMPQSIPIFSDLCRLMRNAFVQELENYPQYARALVPGIVIGDDSALSAHEAALYKMMGLSHITAVSGAHVSLVIGGVIGVIGLRKARTSALCALCVLMGLVSLVGAEPSVLRAGCMGILLLIGVAVRRHIQSLPILAAVVIVVCLCVPRLAVSLGFVLSVVSTAAIITIAYPLSSWLIERLPKQLAWSVPALIVPLIAGIVTLPCVAGIQPQGSAWSVVANTLAAPAIAPLTICGLIAVILVPWLPALAQPFLHFAHLCAAWISAVTAILAKMPGSGISPWLACAAHIISLGIIIVFVRFFCAYEVSECQTGRIRHIRRIWRSDIVNIQSVRAVRNNLCVKLGNKLRGGVPRSAQYAVVSIAVAILMLGCCLFPPPILSARSAVSNEWEIVQCDIGQGSALLARRGSETVLVDVGPEDGGIERCLRDARVDTLDLLILSHFDLDHVGGLEDALSEVEITQVWVSGNPSPVRNSQKVYDLLRYRGISTTIVKAGAEFGGWVRILAPQVSSKNDDLANEQSLVVFIQTLNHAVLDLADVPQSVQDDLVSLVPIADTVIVGHHGARSQSKKLAAHLKPSLSLISVGKNNYGHPTPEALEIWQAPLQASTVECGWIEVSSSTVQTQRRCSIKRHNMK